MSHSPLNHGCPTFFLTANVLLILFRSVSNSGMAFKDLNVLLCPPILFRFLSHILCYISTNITNVFCFFFFCMFYEVDISVLLCLLYFVWSTYPSWLFRHHTFQNVFLSLFAELRVLFFPKGTSYAYFSKGIFPPSKQSALEVRHRF